MNRIRKALHRASDFNTKAAEAQPGETCVGFVLWLVMTYAVHPKGAP